MVKLTQMFVMSILIFWLSVSGCIGGDTEEGTGLPETPGANVSENASAGQNLTQTDIQEFEQNVTDLEDLLNNSSEEIVVEEL